MPTYEYECTACKHCLEAEQRMSDPVLEKCPACHKKKLQRLISSSNFQLKGTGWYVTDFKDKPKEHKDASKEKAVVKKEDTTSGTTTSTA